MTNNPEKREKAVKKYRCECGDRIANTPPISRDTRQHHSIKTEW
jgi:hypothetical protein